MVRRENDGFSIIYSLAWLPECAAGMQREFCCRWEFPGRFFSGKKTTTKGEEGEMLELQLQEINGAVSKAGWWHPGHPKLPEPQTLAWHKALGEKFQISLLNKQVGPSLVYIPSDRILFYIEGNIL